MRLNAFMFWTRKTWQGSSSPDLNKVHAAMGLCGESGEVIDALKKAIFTPHRLREKGIDINAALAEELGDVIYYWARLVDECGFDPEEVIGAVVAKLEKRYPTAAEES